MDIAKAKKLLEQAGMLGCTELHPFFTADPLCYPDLWELLDKANSLGMKIVFYTNAQDLGPMERTYLMGYRKVALTVSLDACTEGVYKRVRPGLDFETVVQNVEAALQLARTSGHETRLNYVLIPGVNDHEAVEFQATWHDKADAITVVPNDSRGRIAGDDHSSTGGCGTLWTGLSVLSDGTAVMCCQDYKPLAPLGNVFDESLEAIWNGPMLQWVRELHRTGRKNQIAACASCKTRY